MFILTETMYCFPLFTINFYYTWYDS